MPLFRPRLPATIFRYVLAISWPHQIALLTLTVVTFLLLLTLTDTRINFAVEAAAKCGAIGTTCVSPSDTAAYGASIAGLPGLDASDFSVTTTSCGLNVTVTYSYAGVVLPTIRIKPGRIDPG
jgi:hypothetical protein